MAVGGRRPEASSDGAKSRRPPGFFLNVAPALLYVFAIFYGGSRPNPELPEVGWVGADKLIHFVAFAGMQLAMLRAVRYELPGLGFVRQLVVAALSCIAVGALLELYQLLLPERTADVVDLVADAAGACGAAFVLWLVFRRDYDEPS